MGKACRIRCTAAQGSFDDEFIIRLPIVHSDGRNGEARCLAYAESVDIRGDLAAEDEVDAVLHAYCLDQKKQLAAIVLPQSTFENGPNVIVRDSDLVT